MLHTVYSMGIYRRHTSYCVLYGIYIRCASYCVLYGDLQKMYIILCIVWGFTEDVHHTVYCFGIYRRCTSYCVLYGDLRKTCIILVYCITEQVCLSKPECGRQTLQELFIRPVQRLPSVILLLGGDHVCVCVIFSTVWLGR